MKKITSVFLSLCIIVSCMVGFSITAGAANVVSAEIIAPDYILPGQHVTISYIVKFDSGDIDENKQLLFFEYDSSHNGDWCNNYYNEDSVSETTCTYTCIDHFIVKDNPEREDLTFTVKLFDETYYNSVVIATKTVPLVVGTCNIIFNANGGSGTMTSQTVPMDVGTALKANAFTRECHSFGGWNTKADGTGTSYADKASVTLTADTTLYAQWRSLHTHTLTRWPADSGDCITKGHIEYWVCTGTLDGSGTSDDLGCGKWFSDVSGTTEIEDHDSVYTTFGAHKYRSVKENETAETCTTAGSYDEVEKCSVCNDVRSRTTRTIPALGHSYTSFVTTEPTCTTTGVRTYTCSRCRDSYTEVIPALGHDYTSAVTTEPTCITTGVRTYTCSRCRDSYTEVIPLAAHKYTTVHENEIAPDCFYAGYYDEVEKCSVCGDEKSRTAITVPALGHTFENGVCTRCGAVEVKPGGLADLLENAAGDRLILALDSDEAVAKLKFPKNVKEIVIDGCGHTLTFSGAAAIKPDRKLTLYDITIKAEKKDKPQNITLTAAAGGLVLEKVTFDGKKTTVNAKKGDLTLIGVTAENLFVRGDPKTELTVGGTVNAAKITGFGKVLLNGTLTASETLNIGAITFVEGSVLNAPKNAAITFKNGLSGTGTINLADGFKPLTIKGTIGGKITLTADKPLAEGQLIFKSKLTDLIDVFDISGIAPVVNDGTYEYRLYVKSSKVYLRAFKMQVGDTTYCEWADIMSGITKAGKSGESYSLNLLGNVDLGKTFKLPTKGKYGGLTIDGNGHTLTYSGSSITLTGNLKLTNLTLTATAKNGCTIKQGSFTLDAGGAELVNCKIK